MVVFKKPAKKELYLSSHTLLTGELQDKVPQSAWLQRHEVEYRRKRRPSETPCEIRHYCEYVDTTEEAIRTTVVNPELTKVERGQSAELRVRD